MEKEKMKNNLEEWDKLVKSMKRPKTKFRVIKIVEIYRNMSYKEALQYYKQLQKKNPKEEYRYEEYKIE